MKQFLLIFVLVLGGCTAIDRAVNHIAPNQTEIVQATDPVTGVTTNSIVEVPGTHEPLPITKDTAAAIPYGTFALGLLLLGVNFYQSMQAKKLKLVTDQTATGLKATVLAIEQASQDPEIKDAITKLKVALANAHQVAGVEPIIRDILAKA